VANLRDPMQIIIASNTFIRLMLDFSSLEMHLSIGRSINPVKKKRKQFYLKSQFLPRSKHFDVGYNIQSLFVI